MKVILIGRDPDKCDIYREVKDDSFVSRQHAQMMQDDDGRVYLLDLESKTGTFVNGNEVFGQTELKQGDFVKIGNTLLQWQSFFKQKASEIISEEPTIPEHQEVSRPQNEEPSVSEQKSSSYVRYASFGQRVGAAVIDLIIVSLVGFLIDYLIYMKIAYDFHFINVYWLLISIPVLTYFIYSVVLESRSQKATFGKQVVGIHVESETEKPLNFGTVFLRNSAKTVSTVILLIGWFAPLWEDKKQCLHDKLAATIIIETYTEV